MRRLSNREHISQKWADWGDGGDDPEGKFMVCANDGNGYEVYQDALTETDAVRAYREEIEHCVDPGAIFIAEKIDTGKTLKLRTDLQKEVWEALRARHGMNEINAENVRLTDLLDLDKADEIGFTFYRGANWVDYAVMSLEEMAQAEARSTVDARRRRLQTTVDPSRGSHVSWKNPDSRIAKEYNLRVEELVRAL